MTKDNDNTIEYDESLTSLLLSHGFNSKNIDNLIPVKRFYLGLNDFSVIIGNIKSTYEGGYIFKLPGTRRDGKFFLFHTIVSPDEIRRRLELIAFL